MATVAEHREEIKDEIIEGSFTDAQVDKLINLAVKKASSLVLIPILERVRKVTTSVDTPFIDNHADYGHNLFAASYSDGKIQVLTSLGLLLREYPLFDSDNETGVITHCCVTGSQIAIHPIPTEEKELTIFFYAWPATLSDTGNIDQYIPDADMQEEIVQNYVLWRLHKKIEDGLEGALSNTNYHKREFYRAIEEFSKSITQGQTRPEVNRSNGWSI